MIKKTFKILGKTLLVIFILLNLVILFSGRWYLYKGLWNTYCKGRSGVSATEYLIFENRKIEANSPEPWPIAKNYNTAKMPIEIENDLKSVQIHAYAIIKNDTLVHEQYWDNFSDTSHTNSFSMGKSYTSALLGCAIKDGYIKSIDEPVSTYIPEFKNDWRKAITLKHLATMSSGIAFDESYSNPFSYPAEGYYSTDLLKATLRYTEKVFEPGTQFDYLSGNTALLGYCITKAINKSLSEYMSEKLWTPMGCEQPAWWSVDKANGLEKAFCCINSNVKDFARMGKLYMHYGNWNGKQLMDSSFIANSIVPFDGLDQDGVTKNHTYGYSWWLTEYKGLKIFYMRGLLNQYVICIPEKKLVIAKLGRKRRAPSSLHTPPDVALCIDAALEMYGK